MVYFFSRPYFFSFWVLPWVDAGRGFGAPNNELTINFAGVVLLPVCQ
jgi:hypothetical protein